jgi:endonuclease-3
MHPSTVSGYSAKDDAVSRYALRVAQIRSPKTRARVINERLSVTFRGTAEELCALKHENPFQLLVATILSAQCTDVRVNMVMPEMIRRFPTAHDLAAANPEDVEAIIRSTGFYHAKTQHLLGMANALITRYAGEVPTALVELVTLPGVGRKTGNVIRSVAFGLPGLPVDTHVGRLSRRLGLTTEEDPVKVERVLGSLLPDREWGGFSLRLILHGRSTCLARKPRCGDCELVDLCPSAPLLNPVPKRVKKVVV